MTSRGSPGHSHKRHRSLAQVEVRLEGRLGSYAAHLAPFCNRSLRGISHRLGVKAGSEISVLLCDGPTMRELNKKWRSVDRPTNVLAFPLHDIGPGRAPPADALGDIVICLPVARREARALGIELRLHVAHLLIHGFLHLLGYDHQSRAEAERMERRERRLLEGMA